jgi:hypothetical protein
MQKRTSILSTLTTLVEIDLLHSGERMTIVGTWPRSDYAILLSRSWQRPRAHLLPFGLRDPIPAFPVPLRKGEEEPPLDLGAVLAGLYDRAGYDLRVDYRRSAEPPLAEADAAWARTRLEGLRA